MALTNPRNNSPLGCGNTGHHASQAQGNVHERKVTVHDYPRFGRRGHRGCWHQRGSCCPVDRSCVRSKFRRNPRQQARRFDAGVHFQLRFGKCFLWTTGQFDRREKEPEPRCSLDLASALAQQTMGGLGVAAREPTLGEEWFCRDHGARPHQRRAR
jgi:hypothetical protein